MRCQIWNLYAHAMALAGISGYSCALDHCILGINDVRHSMRSYSGTEVLSSSVALRELKGGEQGQTRTMKLVNEIAEMERLAEEMDARLKDSATGSGLLITRI